MSDAPFLVLGRNAPKEPLHRHFCRERLLDLNAFSPNGQPAIFAVAPEEIATAARFRQALAPAQKAASVVTTRLPQDAPPLRAKHPAVAALPWCDDEKYALWLKLLAGEEDVPVCIEWFFPLKPEAKSFCTARRLCQLFMRQTLEDAMQPFCLCALACLCMPARLLPITALNATVAVAGAIALRETRCFNPAGVTARIHHKEHAKYMGLLVHATAAAAAMMMAARRIATYTDGRQNQQTDEAKEASSHVL